MNQVVFLFLLVIFQTVSAQQKVVEVISAERRFAQFAQDRNTRDAFLQFMDSTAVVFNKGIASPAKTVWTERKPDQTVLLWQPAFAGISSSGELGFTTGPWAFKPSAGDSSVAFGQFATVWHKTPAGEWKFLLDLGISFPKEMNYKPSQVETIKIQRRHQSNKRIDAMEVENKFLSEYKMKGNEFIMQSVDLRAWVNIQGHAPLKGILALQQSKNLLPSGMEFAPIDGGMSIAQDLAYVYGNVNYGGKQENYLRVWQRINQKWTIILMVIK